MNSGQDPERAPSAPVGSSDPGSPEESDGPLSTADIRELARAMHRSAHIDRAGRMAAVNGWILGISAAISALLAPFASGGLIAFAVLAALSWNEFRGKRMVDALNPEGARVLWKNQAALMAGVLIYCLWSIHGSLSGPVDPGVAELEAMMPELAGLMQELAVAFYVVLALATVLFQGGMIRFYRKRIAMIEQYLEETPPWTVEVTRVVRSGGTKPL